MYVVTGATGNIGSALAEKLLSSGQKVRVIGRSADRLKRLTDMGAEPATGSVEDASFLRQAFAGARGIFTLIPPDVQSPDPSGQQDRIGTAITEAVAAAKPEAVVNLSSVGAEHASGTGPIAGLHRQEKRLNAVKGTRVLHLRPTYFMENFLMGIPMLKHMGVFGNAIRADLPMFLIATRDIAEAAAKYLLNPTFQHGDVQLLLGTGVYTMQQVARTLGAAIGKPDLAYVQFPYADSEKGMIGAGISPAVAALFIEMNKAMNDGKVFTYQQTAANSTPTTLEQFAPIFAAAYRS